MKNKKRILTFLCVIASAILMCTLAFAAAKMGDIDGDGEINAGDARLVLRAAVGLEKLTDAQKTAADVDGDGQITAADARLVLRAAVGLETLPELTPDEPATCEHVFEDKWTAEVSKNVKTGRHYRTCTKCTYTEYADCQYDESKKYSLNGRLVPDCENSASLYIPCAICNGGKATVLPKLGHSFGAWTADRDSATNALTGTHSRVCATCKKPQTENCNIVTVEAKAASCTSNGNTQGQSCSVCKAVVQESIVIQAYNHPSKTYEAVKDINGTATGKHNVKCNVCLQILETVDCTLGNKIYTSSVTAATCTKAVDYYQKCAYCTYKKTYHQDALKHDWQPTTIKGDDYQEYQCTKCKDKKTEYTVNSTNIAAKLADFNTKVNTLKSVQNTVSGFRVTQSDTDINLSKSELKYSTAMKILLNFLGDEASSMSESEMLKTFTSSAAGSDTYNEAIYYDNSLPATKWITKDNMYLKGTDYVSQLTVSDLDVSGCKQEKVNGLDFLDALDESVSVRVPTTITTGDGPKTVYINRTFNLKDRALTGEYNKVTFAIKNETLSDLKKTTEKSSLQHISDFDLREVANVSVDDNNFGNMGDDSIKINMTNTCEGASSKGTVTYYFNASTGAPVAAVYDLTYSVEQLVSFTCDMNLDLGEDTPDALKLLQNWGKEIITGKIDMNNSYHYTEYYFFA